MIGVLYLVAKKFKKLLQILEQIKRVLFWNFLIRYFQASFIGFNFTAISNLQSTKQTIVDKVISSVILAV